MKKIGLVTYYNNNYGSILQCYSTKHFVEKLGYESVLIYVNKKNIDNIIEKIIKLFKIITRSITHKGYLKKALVSRRALKTEINYLSLESLSQMDIFVQTILQPKGYFWKDICCLGKSDEFVAFIVGSDQIWNASRNIEPLYFLKFTEKKKKIAFATSFGVEKIPEYNIRAIKKGISDFEKISVREETGKKIVESISKIDVVRIADPTLLLDGEEWKSFYQGAEVPNEPYIFVHFLNKPSELAINAINWLAEKMNCNILCFAYRYDEYKLFNKFSFMDGNPKEYIALIDNAEAACTDSFHTTLFSINLITNFYTFHRQYLHEFPQTSRIVDLLKRYSLEDRLISNMNAVQTTYESEVDNCRNIVEYERECVRSFLITEIKKRDILSN